MPGLDCPNSSNSRARHAAAAPACRGRRWRTRCGCRSPGRSRSVPVSASSGSAAMSATAARLAPQRRSPRPPIDRDQSEAANAHAAIRSYDGRLSELRRGLPGPPSHVRGPRPAVLSRPGRGVRQGAVGQVTQLRRGNEVPEDRCVLRAPGMLSDALFSTAGGSPIGRISCNHTDSTEDLITTSLTFRRLDWPGAYSGIVSDNVLDPSTGVVISTFKTAPFDGSFNPPNDGGDTYMNVANLE